MSESIGAALRKGREQRQLTLEQVSEATRIRGHYLQALENGDLSAIPSAAQARGFLRIYAQFLDLDLQALIPPPAAAAQDAPTTPVKETSSGPSAPAAASEPGAGARGLLMALRDRLARRLAPKAPAASDGSAESASASQADGKKKAQR